jgi:micrococcal nuclease
MKLSRKTRQLWRWGGFVVLVFGIGLVSGYVFDRLPYSDTEREKGIPESIAEEEGGEEAGSDTGSESGEAESPEAETSYPVVHIYDGDTFTARMPDGSIETVRLIGIDAPETGVKYTKRECYGDEATAALVGLIGGKSVRLVSDSSQDDRDAYDRLLRYVTLPDGTDVGLRMIEKGFAWEYTFRGREYRRQADYRSVESRAREMSVGLWGMCTLE